MQEKIQKAFERYLNKMYISLGKNANFSKINGKYKDNDVALHYATWCEAYSLAKEESASSLLKIF